MRSAILFALALIVGSAFALPPTHSEQKATVPPGPPLPLAVETVKPVNDDPVPVPAADPLEIVAYIGGQEITTEHVELPVGRLLTLKPRGTAIKDDATPAVHWSMNRESLDYSIFPDHGHHLNFSATEAGTWLFVAAVNNSEPLLPPHVAMRWVVVTGAQPPPSTPTTPTKPTEPTEPSEPVDPATPAKVTKVTYVYEKDRDGEPSSGVMAALDKLNRQGILATKYEDDTINGRTQEVPLKNRVALQAAREKGDQAALVIEYGTNVTPKVWHNVRTEQDVMEAIK